MRDNNLQSIVVSDITVIVGLTILLSIILVLDEQAIVFPLLGALRIVLGVVVLLFIPGYLLQHVFFPERDQLTLYERLGLSLVLSFASIPILAILIEFSPLTLTLPTIFACISVYIVFLIFIVQWQRRKIPFNERPYFHMGILSLETTQKIFSSRLLLTGAGVIGLGFLILGTIAITDGPSIFDTEFYILGEQGKAQEYPREANITEPLHISAVVSNLEGKHMIYEIEVLNENHLVAQTDPFEVLDNTTHQVELTFLPVEVGENSRFVINLYKTGDDVPYRVLHLWVNITES